MPRKKKEPLSFVEAMRKLIDAGIEQNYSKTETDDDLLSLDKRIQTVLGIVTSHKRNRGKMLFFVMYDIESNKVRRLVAKYLERNGCTRVQKSIFLGEQPIQVCEKIKNDLATVQAAYDNQDSIIVLPVTTDYLRMMKIIGKEVDLDIITRTSNTLFF